MAQESTPISTPAGTPIEPPVRCGTMLRWAGVIASVDRAVRVKVIDGVTFLEPVDETECERPAPDLSDGMPTIGG